MVSLMDYGDLVKFGWVRWQIIVDARLCNRELNA